MITCDLCGAKKDHDKGIYPDDVIANISMSNKNSKSSETIPLFRGHACKPCFLKLAGALKNEAERVVRECAEIK